MDPIIEQTLAAFTSISLDTLNSKAEMLARLDNKYILPAARLAPAVGAFAELFRPRFHERRVRDFLMIEAMSIC